MHSSCPGRTLRSFKTGLSEMAHRYNHKLMKLAEAVLREVVDFKVEEDRFQVSQVSSCPQSCPTNPSVDLTPVKFVSFAKMHVIMFQCQCALCELSTNVPGMQCCSPYNTAMPRPRLSPHDIAHTNVLVMYVHCHFGVIPDMYEHNGCS